MRRLSDCQKFFFERRLEEDEEVGEGVRVRTLAEILEAARALSLEAEEVRDRGSTSPPPGDGIETFFVVGDSIFRQRVTKTRLKLIFALLMLVAPAVGLAGATSFADMESMALMEQMMEMYGYDVDTSWMTEMHGEDVYIVAYNNHTNSSEIPVQAINDTFVSFSVLVHHNGFSVEGMYVMCAFNDGYFGNWYVSRELADQIWYTPQMPFEWFIDQVVETYSVGGADF